MGGTIILLREEVVVDVLVDIERREPVFIWGRGPC